MIRPFEIAAVATLALLMSTVPTFAQLEGTWQCEMTYTELTPQGQRTSGYIKQYIMGVYAGGGLEVQGSYTGIGGLTQFQVQGQWQIDQGHFMAQAQGMQQSQWGTMPEMFVMLGLPSPDGSTMSYNHEQRDASGSYVMSRQLFACRRG